MSAGNVAAPYFDLATVRLVRGVVAGLDPAGEPEAVVLMGAEASTLATGSDPSLPPAGGDPPLKRESGIAGDSMTYGVSSSAGEVSLHPGPSVLGGERDRDAVALGDGIGFDRPIPPQNGGAGGATPCPDTPHSPLRTAYCVLRTFPGPLAIAVIAGSFDPPTNAHLALARAAREAGGCDAIYLALSRHTVDKEARTRPSDADRALLLAQIAAREPGLGVLLFNRGLYADQAVAARAAFPNAAISFVVGFDKAQQIFDPRYYDDRDAALRQLFAHVSLLVAPRAADGPGALAALLDRPENAPFRDAVRALPFDPAWAADSSTVVRAASRAGEPFAALVPPETVAFVAALDPYAAPDPAGTPDRYERREALIARLAVDPADREALSLWAPLSRG